jgi:hypothetical protein
VTGPIWPGILFCWSSWSLQLGRPTFISSLPWEPQISAWYIVISHVLFEVKTGACNLILSVTRPIRKVSTDCKYFCCNAAVVVLRMCTDFSHLLARLRRHYEDIRSYLRFVLCI